MGTRGLMARKRGSYELSEDIERAKREITQHAEQEREQTAREVALLMRHLRGLEQALVSAAEEVGRIERVVRRRQEAATEDSSADDEAPAKEPRPAAPRAKAVGEDSLADGAMLIATRLAQEGHSRADVLAFLEENFDNIDAAATVDALFSEEEKPQTADA